MTFKKFSSFIKNIKDLLKPLWDGEGNTEISLELREVIKGPVRFGLIVTGAVILFFVVWSGLAPLQSAAIATGTVVLKSNKKTVQHLEGGIISEIMVKEGDIVEVGQPLISLNHTSANARQELLLGQLLVAKATEARLNAERDKKDHVEFDPELLQRQNDPEIEKIIENQKKLFSTRIDSLNGQINILKQKIEQSNEQLAGLDAQRKATQSQLRLIKEELVAKKQLLDKGYVKKPEYLALQRNQANLEGQEGQYTSEIARTKESITETQLQIISAKNEFDKEAAADLKEVQSQISDLKEQLLASSDILERTVITAQQAGKITGLQYHTVGGVISPGAPILDIVPMNDKLVIDAQVSVNDIDIVHAGLTAKIMLSAYKARAVPRLDGMVIDVSADRFTDPNSGVPYYKARVEIDADNLKKLTSDVELYPGMPAEVFIVTGEGTFLDYLFEPLTQSFRRAFKEQ